ncbi:MAG: hypothetical protein ACTSXK_12610 [Promethearchaeota archaeon]
MLMYGTPETEQALNGLRDLSQLGWIIIPLLALLFYIYVTEIKKARETKNWDIIFAGLTLFGMDFFNETWNGWVCWLTQKQGFWTTPGPTALRVTIGWNVEIIFMFAISGIIFAKSFSDNESDKILGLPNRWFWAIGYSAFCVFIEIFLNIGGLLTWYYPFWNRSFGGVWLIFLFGYFHFYVTVILVLKIKSLKKRSIVVGIIYTVPILMNIIAGIMGWVY